LKWLNVHNLHEKQISRLRILDLEWPRKIVDLGEVDIFDVVG
jgi:hypothetical protein